MLGEAAELFAVALVADRLGQVLDEVAPAEHVQQLEPTADRERRHVALERALEQRELPGVPVLLRGVGRRMTLGAVGGRVDVDPAREDDAVEDVERVVDRVGARRDDERPSAGPLDRLHVEERHERRGQLPRAPARRLCVGRDPDQRPLAHGYARYPLNPGDSNASPDMQVQL